MVHTAVFYNFLCLRSEERHWVNIRAIRVSAPGAEDML